MCRVRWRGLGSRVHVGCTRMVLRGGWAPGHPSWGVGWGGAACSVYCSALELSSSESMSGGSGSSKNVRSSLGVYFPPVKVNAPDSFMNLVRAAIPLGVPRSSGRASSQSSSLTLAQWFSYRVQDHMMCSWVLRGSLHSQLMFFLGKNCFLNSPMYAWPVQCCIRQPKTSHWFLSSVKCLVGLRDGGILLAIANFPLQGALCHLCAQAVCVVALAQHRVKGQVHLPCHSLLCYSGLGTMQRWSHGCYQCQRTLSFCGGIWLHRAGLGMV